MRRKRKALVVGMTLVTLALAVGRVDSGTGASTATAGEEFPNVTVKTFTLSGEFKQPWQVAWVGNGTKRGAVVFTDRGANQVGALDPATGKTTAFSLKVITAPNPIAVIDDNRYAIGGTGGVAIFDRRGSGSIRELQFADTQVLNIARGPDGHLWFTNILNGQVVSIRDPYSGPADVTKFPPLPGCRPTGIVPGVTDVVLLCQQSNDIRFLDPVQGTEIRRVPLADPAVGAQEARPIPGGGITFSGFGKDRVYSYTPRDNLMRFALTGSGPAVPLVTGMGASYAQLFAKRPASFTVGVPHYKAGGLTLATFPAGTSRQLDVLKGRNLVGLAHGPGCTILVADATPGKPAIHSLQFSYKKAKNRLHTCITASKPDFLARLAMPFFSKIPAPPKAPKTVVASITGASSDPWHAGATFNDSFRLSATVTATTSAGKTYKPAVKVTDTGPHTRVVRITNIRAATRGMTLTVTGQTELPVFVQIDAQETR